MWTRKSIISFTRATFLNIIQKRSKQVDNNKGRYTFPDDSFLGQMEEKVAPFLKEKVQEGNCTGWDGTGLHYYYANREHAKGSMVI